MNSIESSTHWWRVERAESIWESLRSCITQIAIGLMGPTNRIGSH
jgi:hypothetical protein